MSAPYPNPTSALYEIVCDFNRAANNKDIDKLASYLADDFAHQLWPSTMRQPDQNQPASKDVWVGRFKAFCDGWFEEVGLDIDHPVNVVEGDNVIVIQLSSQGKFKSGRENHQEYLCIFRFNKDNKIVRLDEWLDSAYAMKVWPGEVMPKFDKDGWVTNVEEAKQAAAKK